MTIPLRYTLLDVFTNRPLTGNALAVFTGAGDLPTVTLQAIAREMNLAEVVFLYPAQDGGQARLRIFTPAKELPFAGHPTLGAAAVVGRALSVSPIVLETGGGPVTVALVKEGAEVRAGFMQVPLPTSVTEWANPGPVLAALGLESAALPPTLYDLGPKHLVIGVDDVEVLRGLDPDMGALAQAHGEGIAVFARSGSGLEARVFVPGLKVPEDAATGSAAGPIAAHAAAHGWIAYGQEVEIAQGEAIQRPSQLLATAQGGPEGLTGLEVGGDVVIIGRGELRIPR